MEQNAIKSFIFGQFVWNNAIYTTKTEGINYVPLLFETRFTIPLTFGTFLLSLYF